MNIQVKGIFTKRKGFIYRTKTFIQFGDSEKIIGSCILCNPGSAKLYDSEEEKRLVKYDEVNGKEVELRVAEDPTMNQLIKILKNTGACKDGGRFLIHNLFTLRNGNMNKALKEFENPNIDKNLLYKDYDDYLELQEEIPWTLIGWGCKDNKVLNDLKIDWMKNLSENNVRSIGYKHKKSPHYYHPRPQLKSKQEEYLKIISNDLQELLKTVS